jgi:hypothetical protein
MEGVQNPLQLRIRIPDIPINFNDTNEDDSSRTPAAPRPFLEQRDKLPYWKVSLAPICDYELFYTYPPYSSHEVRVCSIQ